MIKQLHSTLLFFSVLFVTSIQAQSIVITENLTDFDYLEVMADSSELLDNSDLFIEKDFSYLLDAVSHSHDLEVHKEKMDLGLGDISLIDIISSDEGADFNCSGGFCMDKSHFHKRGLTLKKQLFDYFMKISC